MIGVPLIAQLNFTGFLYGQKWKKPYLLLGINLRVLSLAAIAVTMLRLHHFSVPQVLLIIYAELLLFTLSGAFAGVCYVDLIGKSFTRELRRRFFTRKQFISSVGILVSAVIARQVLSLGTFPFSYTVLFLAAAGVLLIATGGFWMIHETPGSGKGESGYLKTLRSIPGVLKQDPNLRVYLVYINSIGFHVALIPFYVAYARLRYQLDPALAGNLLFFQIAGMVGASFLWPRVVKARGFKGVLTIWSGLSFILPPAALIIGGFLPLPFYLALFFVVGAVVGARTVSQEAVTIELSTDENRVLYTGIIGTLNLSIALFPILIGSLITRIGYGPVFITVALLAAFSLVLLRRLTCPVDISES